MINVAVLVVDQDISDRLAIHAVETDDCRDGLAFKDVGGQPEGKS